MEFRFICGMEIYWTSLRKVMIIKDKHLLLLIHTGRNVFICRMSLKLHFYHQGNWEDWNVRPFWEFFFWLWVWLKWDELCALCMKQVCICHLLLSSFSKFVIFFLLLWLSSFLVGIWLLIDGDAYNTHIDGQTDTNSLIFQVKSWVAQLGKVAMPF